MESFIYKKNKIQPNTTIEINLGTMVKTSTLTAQIDLHSRTVMGWLDKIDQNAYRLIPIMWYLATGKIILWWEKPE